jgi:hypothetical protein
MAEATSLQEELSTQKILPVESEKRHFSLTVKEVSKPFILTLPLGYSKLESVDMYSWVEVDKDTAIANFGAAPCSSIYVKCLATGRTISGHFLHNSERYFGTDVSRALRSEWLNSRKPTIKDQGGTVLIPSEQEIEDFARPAGLEQHRRYRDMISRVRDWVLTYGAEEMEAYLFGQHFMVGQEQSDLSDELRVAVLTSDLIWRLDSMTDLKSAGVLSGRIMDCRQQALSLEDVADDTFYDPGNGIIYLHRGI